MSAFYAVPLAILLCSEEKKHIGREGGQGQAPCMADGLFKRREKRKTILSLNSGKADGLVVAVVLREKLLGEKIASTYTHLNFSFRLAQSRIL